MVLARFQVGALVLASFLAIACHGPVERSGSWTVMGRTAEVRLFVATAHDAEQALASVEEAMRKVETTMSFADAGSELTRLNAAAREDYYSIQDHDLYRCVLLALDWARASRGAFDPTVGPLTRLYGVGGDAARLPLPGEIETQLASVGWDRVALATEARAIRFGDPGIELDLGGVAKGFALDVAARVLARPGSRGALLRIGGNVYAWSHPPGRPEWDVVLQDPRAPSRGFVTVRVANRGLAASGNPEGLERAAAGWVVDPRSGRPAAGDVRVAVAIADSGADADAISTSLLASDYHDATDLLSRARRVEAILLVHREERPHLLVSASLQGRIDLSPELAEEIGGDVRYLLPPLGD